MNIINSHQELDVLIQRIQEGETEAYDIFVKQIQPLLNLAMRDRFIDANDRDDLKQEIMLRLCRILPHLDTQHPLPFQHYLNRMIKLVKIDYRRKRARHVAYTQKLNGLYVKETQVCGYRENMLERRMLRAERDAKIQEVMPKLSALERRVVHLLLQGYKPQEVAAKCDVQEKTVYNAVYRCKKKIKRYLSHTYFDVAQPVFPHETAGRIKARKIDN